MQIDLFSHDPVFQFQRVEFLTDCPQFENQIDLENDCSVTKCALIHFCLREFYLSSNDWNALTDQRRLKYLEMSLDLLKSIAKAMPPKLCN